MAGQGLCFDIAAWALVDKPGEKPELPEVPSMLRRRASLADRMALKAAFEAWPSQESIPTVFCSRHGEEHRSVELLNLMAAGEGHSPMSFSLSVHNAASGLFGISRGDAAASSSLGAGKETLAMGMAEACGLLSQGHAAVLLVNYDDALPEPLKAFGDESDRPYALALLMKPGSAYRLERCESESPDGEEPQGLKFADFLKSSAAELRANRWRWTRGA